MDSRQPCKQMRRLHAAVFDEKCHVVGTLTCGSLDADVAITQQTNQHIKSAHIYVCLQIIIIICIPQC